MSTTPLVCSTHALPLTYTKGWENAGHLLLSAARIGNKKADSDSADIVNKERTRKIIQIY